MQLHNFQFAVETFFSSALPRHFHAADGAFSAAAVQQQRPAALLLRHLVRGVAFIVLIFDTA